MVMLWTSFTHLHPGMVGWGNTDRVRERAEADNYHPSTQIQFSSSLTVNFCSNYQEFTEVYNAGDMAVNKNIFHRSE